MHSTLHATPTATPLADAGKTRIVALDLIRGVAVLGILAVNADGFAAPMPASLNPLAWPFPNEGLTALSFWLMDTLFHEKFVSVFSMLFGVSLFLVGGERGDRTRGRVLARRLAVLFGFGMLHGFGLWWGDILSLYAATGALMFFCRSWGPKTLLAVGLLLFEGLTLSRMPPTAAPPDPAAIAARRASVDAAIAQASSSWAGAYEVNTRQYLRLLSGYPSLLPATLGLMMIGLSLFKSGFLAGRSSTRRYGATIAAAGAALLVISWLCWQKDIAGAPLPAGDTVKRLLAPLVGLGYAALLVLLLRGGAGAVLAPFAAVGRMAFTNYLTQSMIMTTIFYGGRGALMGEVDRPALWLLVFGVWALQLAWSPWWLARFEMGPFEWAWRCLTLGRRVPLRRPT